MLAEREPWLAAVTSAAMVLVAVGLAAMRFFPSSTLAPTLELEPISLDDIEYRTAVQERSPPLVSEDRRKRNITRTVKHATPRRERIPVCRIAEACMQNPLSPTCLGS
jgi:hypothetical protein